MLNRIPSVNNPEMLAHTLNTKSDISHQSVDLGIVS